MIGRASATLGSRSLQMLYNALVLPHLQYCLMVWGDFSEGMNKTLGAGLQRHQKKILGMIEGTRGRYHADPVFYKLGILKIEDIYKQQLRVHAWQFANEKLPANQANMLCKVRDSHKYRTRASERGLILCSTQDQRSIKYRLPKVWQSTPLETREAGTLQGLKRKSKLAFLSQYGSFSCTTRDCYVCRRNVE